MLKMNLVGLEVHVRECVRGIARRTEGASAVEYGLLVALIALMIIAAVELLGDSLTLKYNQIATEIGSTS